MEDELNVSEEVVTLDTEAEVTSEVTPEETEVVEIAKPQQDAEENAKYAAARRKAEVEIDRLKAELEAKDQRLNEVVSTAYNGTPNPYTNKPILTQEDYDEYQEMYREDVLEQLGVSKNFIKKEIESNPVVREAQKIINAQKAQQAKMSFDIRLTEITKLDPNIKTIADLMKMPNREEFDEYVLQKGYDIVDAYKLVNHDIKRKPSTAETKDHLIKTGGGAGGDTGIEVPASELAYYQESFPKETNAQLRARYNRVLKRQGE